VHFHAGVDIHSKSLSLPMRSVAYNNR
jgi:hypothetical protein